MRIPKYWKHKAKSFSEYARDNYNEDRALLATLGSFGITFNDDIERLIIALKDFGDIKLAELLEKKDYMFRCGKAIRKLDVQKQRKEI